MVKYIEDKKTIFQSEEISFTPDKGELIVLFNKAYKVKNIVHYPCKDTVNIYIYEVH